MCFCLLSFLLVFFQKSSSFCRENEIFENKKQKSKTNLDHFLTYKKANLGPAFILTLQHIFIYIYIYTHTCVCVCVCAAMHVPRSCTILTGTVTDEIIKMPGLGFRQPGAQKRMRKIAGLHIFS